MSEPAHARSPRARAAVERWSPAGGRRPDRRPRPRRAARPRHAPTSLRQSPAGRARHAATRPASRRRRAESQTAQLAQLERARRRGSTHMLQLLGTPAEAARCRGREGSCCTWHWPSASSSRGASCGPTRRRSSRIIRESLSGSCPPRHARSAFICIRRMPRWCANASRTPTSERAWTIVEDPTLTRGGCLVRTRDLTDRCAAREPHQRHHRQRAGR